MACHGRDRGGDVDSSLGRLAARAGAGGELDGLESARPMDGSQPFGSAFAGIAGLVVAVIPGLAVNLAPGSSLQGNMPADVFWLLSVELQSPQHMLPHLWRMPQWLAWGCYLVLAALALCRPDPRAADPVGRSVESRRIRRTPWPAARLRLSRGAGGHSDRARNGVVCHRDIAITCG